MRTSRFLAAALFVAALAACSEDSPMSGGQNLTQKTPASYHRIDRMGMPAVATALITSKQNYNEANPIDDAAGNFVPEIVDHLTALHNALDDDLTALGLTPATVQEAAAQGAPLVVPDVITVDTHTPSGFPNGRRLTDTVIDITLAVLLLDVNGLGDSNGPHPVTALVGVNPTANDETFSTTFPYLAQPHQP
jgi:Domain of unknown function (DUF4331)